LYATLSQCLGDTTRPIPRAKASTVKEILEDRFGDPSTHDWVIAGDLNDYTETDGMPDNSQKFIIAKAILLSDLITQQHLLLQYPSLNSVDTIFIIKWAIIYLQYIYQELMQSNLIISSTYD
jgi:hypothetical protein